MALQNTNNEVVAVAMMTIDIEPLLSPSLGRHDSVMVRQGAWLPVRNLQLSRIIS